MDDDADTNGYPTWGLEETTTAPSHHVVEHHPVTSENSQPHIEWSTWPGSEPSSVEAHVYVWRFALQEMHTRKKEEENIKIARMLILVENAVYM